MLGGRARERRCPRCGTRVAHQALNCLLCGYRLDRVNYAGALFALVAVAVLAGIAVGALRDRSGRGQSLAEAASTPTPGAAMAAEATEVGPIPSTEATVSTPVALPTATRKPTPTAKPSPTPTAEPTITPTPTPAPTDTPAPPTPTPGPVIHVVESGDSLLYIAKLYGITADEIVAANNISEYTILSIGDELIIPVAAAPAAGGEAAVVEATATSTSQVVVHIVEAGDTLDYLASKYGSTVDSIVAANDGLSKTSVLSVGQEINVPLAQPTPAAEQVTPTAPEGGSATPEATGTPLAVLTPGATTTVLDMGGPAQPHALELLAPTIGAKVPIAELLLNWTGVGDLAPDLWYVVYLWPVNEYADKVTGWTKANSWRPEQDLVARWGTSSHLVWSVGVEREVTAEGQDASQFEPAGPRTEPQDFYLLP